MVAIQSKQSYIYYKYFIENNNYIISKFCDPFALEKRKHENLFYTNVKKYRDF